MFEGGLAAAQACFGPLNRTSKAIAIWAQNKLRTGPYKLHPPLIVKCVLPYGLTVTMCTMYVKVYSMYVRVALSEWQSNCFCRSTALCDYALYSLVIQRL